MRRDSPTLATSREIANLVMLDIRRVTLFKFPLQEVTYDSPGGHVTLCDTRDLMGTGGFAVVRRLATHGDRIARMRDEWIARGGQNA